MQPFLKLQVNRKTSVKIFFIIRILKRNSSKANHFSGKARFSIYSKSKWYALDQRVLIDVSCQVFKAYLLIMSQCRINHYWPVKTFMKDY